MLFTLILLAGSFSSNGGPAALPTIANETSPYLGMLEQLSTGILSTLEGSADFPIRQFFLCEDLDERDEEREDSYDSKGLLTDSSLRQLGPSRALGSSQGVRYALGSNHSLPLLQTVLLRC